MRKRGLGAFVELMGSEASPIEVILRPMGSVQGRLVDAMGRPRPDVEIQAMYLRDQGVNRHVEALDAHARTGPDGRFRIRPLVPGLFYSFEVLKPREKGTPPQSEGHLFRGRWTLKTDIQDWGDVQAKPGHGNE